MKQLLNTLLPNIDIPEFPVNMVIWIFANTWVLEIAIQAYRLWRNEAVYARGSIPDLPEINFREKEEKEEDDSDSYQTKYSMLMMAVKCMLRPHLFVFPLLCLPFGIVVHSCPSVL